ncbi:MAG: TrmH family RNA methyltransferase [Planctomycetota bacterium]
MGEPIPIESLDDPRIAVYRNLPDRTLDNMAGRFVAEGKLLVERLLESSLAVESVLVSQRRLGSIVARIPPDLPLYTVPEPVIHEVVGYQFHSGIIAAGIRPEPMRLDEWGDTPGQAQMLVVLPDLSMANNLGAVLRSARAMGAAGVLLGPRCCDPYYRHSVRTSMGAVFQLPIVRSQDLAADLATLRARRGFTCVAAVADEPDAVSLRDAPMPMRVAIVLGNEYEGIDAVTLAACDQRVRIDMPGRFDSLNVAVAAGIILHHYAGGAMSSGR